MCPETQVPPPENGRRRFLAGAITAIQAAIGATLAFLLGGAAAAPAFGTRRTNWWPAVAVDDLSDNEPTPVTIRVTREDGYDQVVDRQVVFLVKSGATVTGPLVHLHAPRVPGQLERRTTNAEVPLPRRRLRPHGRREGRPPPAPLAKIADAHRRRAGAGAALMGRSAASLDWLDARTGFRAGRSHLLDEPLPAGVGWWFVTGSILLFLIGVQLITGVVLTMYYVPSPEHAYDSVRYITDRLPFGRMVRALHFFGASFIVVAAVIHMLRVVLFGSYKKPREVTWMTGVVLLLLILGFALTGYLLPWDQKAYWATTVTINIARSAPFRRAVAALMRGGGDLGALTLLRWYAAHVFLLPAALIGFVVAHIYLMRRHGISGAARSSGGHAEAVLSLPRAEGHDRDGASSSRCSSRSRSTSGAAGRGRRSVGRDLCSAARVVFPQPLPAAEVLSRPARTGGDDGHPRARGRRPAAAAVPRSPARSAPAEAAARHRRRSRCSAPASSR